MFKFILRRLFYSIFILLGVMLVTFLLFDVASGDPAAAALGEKATPREIESYRRATGGDLPLFWGHWRRAECFSADGKRNFAVPGEKVVAVAETSDGGEKRLEITPEMEVLPEDFTAGVKGEIRYFYWQDNAFNSRFFRALGELVSFKKSFPYVEFLNFGQSLTTREDIGEILKRGVWPSVMLMIPAFSGELVLSVLLSLLAAACRDRLTDRMLVALSVLGMSVSFLVVIIFGQYFFGYYLNLFPVWGWGDARYIALPAVLSILCGVGPNVRFYRAVFVGELGSNYLRTAAAKGCSGERIFSVHLLRNAAIPIITRSTAVLPFLFTGSLLLESFFGIPGLGYAGIEALNNSDLQLLKALVIVSALLFVFFNLLADLLYAWADPRVRLN